MREVLPVLLVVSSLILGACGGDPEPAPPAGPETPAAFLEAQAGKVVVLVLGMEGCANTKAASRALVGMAGDLPADVVAARIDVPPPNGSLEAVDDWDAPVFYDVDEDREVAGRLDFFYYPTVYILDRGGEIRYAGGMEPAKLTQMIEAVRSEKPGDEKQVFTPPLVAIGDAAPPIRNLAFERDGPTLVFFSSTDCPFSTKALDGLVDVELFFGSHDIAWVIVEKSREKAAAEFYDTRDLTGTVVHDPEDEIRGAYGVEPVPFFYVLDDTGTVTARGPYTALAAKQALGALLGVKVEAEPGEKACGAG